MGWERVRRGDVIRAIQNRVGEHLNGEPSISTKNGKQHVKIPIKRSAPLSRVLEAVEYAHSYAEHGSQPTIIHLITENGESSLRLLIPVGTKGRRKGRPVYPHYGLAERALHIAPDYPRKNSPNIREIVGQYLAVHAINTTLPSTSANRYTYSDVEVHVANRDNHRTEYTSDIDLVHVIKRVIGGRTVFEVAPVEVTTNPGSLDYKIRGWKHLLSFLESLARNEGAEMKVTPIVVHVDTGGRRRGRYDVEEALKTVSPSYRVLRIRSAVRARNGRLCTTAGKDQVEYIAGALRNVAFLPRKYHTTLTSAVLSHHSDTGRLEELFREMAALRKIWNSKKIPENVKHLLTDEYAKILLSRKRRALLKAFHTIEQHAGGSVKILERFVQGSYRKQKSRGAREV